MKISLPTEHLAESKYKLTDFSSNWEMKSIYKGKNVTTGNGNTES